jgi:hypothetical protein
MACRGRCRAPADAPTRGAACAPVIGGALGLTVRGPRPGKHRLDVLRRRGRPTPKMLRAKLCLLLGTPAGERRSRPASRTSRGAQPASRRPMPRRQLGGPGGSRTGRGGPPRGHPVPLVDQPSASGDDLDLVCDAANTGQRRDGRERGVVLVLMLGPSLEGQPTVGDGDVNPVGGHRIVRHQRLQSRTADLVVLPPIPGVDPEARPRRRGRPARRARS